MEKKLEELAKAARLKKEEDETLAYIDKQKRAGLLKICPGCRHGVEKIDGCNHMTCYKYCI
jgi:hypothetical protein